MRTWLWTKSPQLVLHKILELSPKKWPKMRNCHKEKESGVGATSPNFLGRANFWSSLLVAVPPLLPCKLFSKLTQMSSYQLQFQMWFVFIPLFFREVDQCQEKIRMRSVTNWPYLSGDQTLAFSHYIQCEICCWYKVHQDFITLMMNIVFWSQSLQICCVWALKWFDIWLVQVVFKY